MSDVSSTAASDFSRKGKKPADTTENTDKMDTSGEETNAFKPTSRTANVFIVNYSPDGKKDLKVKTHKLSEVCDILFHRSNSISLCVSMYVRKREVYC